VLSSLFNNKSHNLFLPTDFDLVISEEAQRSIGWKLGLTAASHDYRRRFSNSNPGTRDPREAKRRLAARHLPHVRVRE
jgi:type I restriction enzyme R subunit